MFKCDRNGVIELPFKLVIASIIIMVTMSVAYGGLQSFSESSMTERVNVSVALVSAAAGDVSTMGINSSVKVKVDLSASMFHRVESFVIGCGPDEDVVKCKGVEYRVSGDKARWVVVKDHAGHDIVMKGKDRRVVLGEGTHEVLLLRALDHIEVSRL